MMKMKPHLHQLQFLVTVDKMIKSFIEFILEKWHSTIPSYYSKGDSMDVYKNPSSAELHKIIHSSESKSARAILHNDDVYVWDAMKGIHHEVNDALKLNQHQRYFLSIGKDRYSSEYNSDGNIRHIKEHPWVHEHLSKHRFFHS